MIEKEDIVTGIYIRVSTEEQVKDGFSIHAQKEKLTKYADANEWHIYDYYIDDGISGKNLDGRPEVTRMLQDVKDGKINNILIYKLDRLTRSVKDLIYLIELFEKYHCTFNSQTEKIDTSNAVGRMFVKIIGIFAEFERENLAERVSFGYEQKTREGNYTNTNGVYGYDYLKGEQKLIVNEREKELVNRIFDLYIDGLSYFKIAKLFNEEKVPTKRGGHWESSTIKSIINNPLYIGKVRYGVKLDNKEKSFTTDGKDIEVIVNEEKWQLANNIVLSRRCSGKGRYPSENSYFFHTIKCGKCGGIIKARQQYRNGKLYITYRCQNALKGFCDSQGFSQQKMERSFLDYLTTLKNMQPSLDIIESPHKYVPEKLINPKIKIRKLNKLLIVKEKQESFSYEDIKDLVINIKINWENLTNKEKQQFLERFVESIKVVKTKEDDVIINNVEFKKEV